MTFDVTTPVLKLPALGWVFLCLFFWIMVLTIGPPEKLSPPEEIWEIFRDDPVMVTKSKDKLSLVPAELQKAIKPLWVIIPLMKQEEKAPVQWLFGWDGKRFHLGVYRRHSQWTYTLNSVRCDTDPDNTRIGPQELSAEDLDKIRPMLIPKLNERFIGGEAGTWFDKVLDTGIEETSYFCLQNVLIVLGWLLLLPALFAVASIFSGRGKPDGQSS